MHFVSKAEAASMHLEGIVSLPADQAGLDRFEAEVRTAKEAGATICAPSRSRAAGTRPLTPPPASASSPTWPCID